MSPLVIDPQIGTAVLDAAGRPYAKLGALLAREGEQATHRIELDHNCPRNQRAQLLGRGRTPYVKLNARGEIVARGWL